MLNIVHTRFYTHTHTHTDAPRAAPGPTWCIHTFTYTPQCPTCTGAIHKFARQATFTQVLVPVPLGAPNLSFLRCSSLSTELTFDLYGNMDMPVHAISCEGLARLTSPSFRVQTGLIFNRRHTRRAPPHITHTRTHTSPFALPPRVKLDPSVW